MLQVWYDPNEDITFLPSKDSYGIAT